MLFLAAYSVWMSAFQFREYQNVKNGNFVRVYDQIAGGVILLLFCFCFVTGSDWILTTGIIAIWGSLRLIAFLANRIFFD